VFSGFSGGTHKRGAVRLVRHAGAAHSGGGAVRGAESGARRAREARVAVAVVERGRSRRRADGRVVYSHYANTTTEANWTDQEKIGQKLSRVRTIASADIGTGDLADASKYAEYTYLGAGTIVKIAHPAVSGGLNLTYGTGGTYGGFDRLGRIVDQTWEDDASSDIDRYTYAYDRNSNRLYRKNEVESTLSELYHAENPTSGTEYDGLNRLVEFHRGTLDGENDGISGNDGGAQAWTLDALGNWSEFKDDSEDGSAWDLDQNRAHNKANEIDGNSGDPIWPEGSSGGWVDPKYDDAGNMIYGPRPGDETSTTEDLVMVYDAWNRLAAVYADDGTAAGEKDDDDTLIAEYRYDGLNRRIAKIMPDAAHSGKYVRTDYYYSLGWQVVEERRDDDLASKDTVALTLKYQYVWGQRYIDAPICRDEDKGDGAGGDPDGDCIDSDDEHLYYTQDANFNVTALVDGSDGAAKLLDAPLW
jgi:hypothetical protein